MRLLTKCSYEKGLKQGIDSTTSIAHKFGERIIGVNSQLHEFGIVFVKGDPYLIGVMTKGSSLPKLTEIVAEISRIIDNKENYRKMSEAGKQFEQSRTAATIIARELIRIGLSHA